MAKKYNDARAVKRTKSSPAAAKEVTVDKKTIKKIKKSPILIVAILFLAIGAVAGFFAAKKLTRKKTSKNLSPTKSTPFSRGP